MTINHPPDFPDQNRQSFRTPHLAAANLKVRFAAVHLLDVSEVLRELEHGEFIYFDDANRLRVVASVEAFLIAVRAFVDLCVSAWWAYRTGESGVDSLNDFLKRLAKGLDWFPVSDGEDGGYWTSLTTDHGSAEFTWLHAIVGRDKGQSLRDIAVHRGVLEIDTIIDDSDHGRFVLQLTRESVGPALPWLQHVFRGSMQLVDKLVVDIKVEEAARGEQS